MIYNGIDDPNNGNPNDGSGKGGNDNSKGGGANGSGKNNSSKESSSKESSSKDIAGKATMHSFIWRTLFLGVVINLFFYRMGFDDFGLRLLFTTLMTSSVSVLIELCYEAWRKSHDQEEDEVIEEEDSGLAGRTPSGVEKVDGKTFVELAQIFTEWKTTNPGIETELKVILGQFETCRRQVGVYRALIESNPQKFAARCPDAPPLLQDILGGIRQNFNDIYNILILAGAGVGTATSEKIDKRMLESELDSNQKKLEYIGRLSAWVVQRINQLDNTASDISQENALEGMEIQAQRDRKHAEGKRLIANGGSPLVAEMDQMMERRL